MNMDALMGLGQTNTTPSQYMGLDTYGANSGYDFAMGNSNQLISGVDSNLPMSNGIGGGEDGGMMKFLLGGKNADGSTSMGALPAGISAGSALLNGWLGMKQYGLAKKQINASIDSSRNNFNAQAKTTNRSIEDRQRYRNATQPGVHQDTASYMAKYGVQEV